jgi:hypothetical protein
MLLSVFKTRFMLLLMNAIIVTVPVGFLYLNVHSFNKGVKSDGEET